MIKDFGINSINLDLNEMYHNDLQDLLIVQNSDTMRIYDKIRQRDHKLGVRLSNALFSFWGRLVL